MKMKSWLRYRSIHIRGDLYRLGYLSMLFFLGSTDRIFFYHPVDNTDRTGECQESRAKSNKDSVLP